MKLTNFLTLILCFNLASAYAQEVISPAGSQRETTSGSLSWTVGETLNESFSDGTNTLTQGFQQSMLTVTAINDLEVPGIQLLVYPNPTQDFLTVEVKTLKEVDLIWSLFDLSGKLVLQKKIKGQLQKVNMQNFNPGAYLLKITENNLEIQTYQIIKH